MLLTLWKKDNEPASRSEEVAPSNAVALFIDRIKYDETPCRLSILSTRSLWIRTTGRYWMPGVRDKEFDITNFLNVLEPYHLGGEYDFLLNSDKQLDLLDKRFVVFEIDAIRIILSFPSDDYHHHGDVYQ